MSTVTLSVARDYSRTPGPRYRWQGPFSGEDFRDLLIEKLRFADKVIIDLDGTRGYGSSFIDEAFGGLVRISKKIGWTKPAILERIDILAKEDLSYRIEALQAMNDAIPE